jgi:membrane protease YdiL (CAAX protease family)
VRRVAVLALVVSLGGCLRPVQRGRTEKLAPPTRAELEAGERARNRRCSLNWGLAFPGLGHMCNRQDGEAAVTGGLAVAEVATAIGVARNEANDHPGVGIPLVALQDLWLIGAVDPYLDNQRAQLKLYVPQDSLADLAAAPFNPCVMGRPWVLGGLAAMLAAGIGITVALDGWPGTDRVGDDPNLFGRTVDGRWGYPAAGAIGVGLFSHVAIAEELVFRGWAQSSMARSQGEIRGWLSASLLFGAVHGFNIFALPEEERREYLMYGVPFITTIGSYLGWLYMREGYSLAPPTAVHFWYDLLLSATFFAVDPQSSPLSAKVTVPF